MRSRIPRIGGRVWKTGAAVTLSLAVCRLFDVPEAIFVAIVALICVQPTVIKTFRYGAEQVQATVIGGIVALGALVLVTYHPYPYVSAVTAGVAAIFAMWLCVVLRWYDALVLAACTVVVVMVQAEVEGNILAYAATRSLTTAIGVGVAIVVNALPFWPKAEEQFPKRLPSIVAQAFEEFEEAVSAFCRHDKEAVRDALANWNKRQKAFDLAVSELSWVRESSTVKLLLPFRRGEIASLFSEIYNISDSIHWAAYRVLIDTSHVLERHPERTLDDDHVYAIMEKSLRSPARLKEAIVDFLHTGDITSLQEVEYDWSFELHPQFAAAMQSAVNGPHDAMPLFEVARVGVEIRNYARYLVSMRELLLENEHLVNRLRQRRYALMRDSRN